jgi:hypothetical protein
MKKLSMFATLAAVAAIAAMAGVAGAKDGCVAPAACGAPTSCADCGARKACRQCDCQVVCEIKKEKKFKWCVECKEVCPLLPGRHCGDPGCKGGCGDHGCNAGCGAAKEGGCAGQAGCEACGGKGCGKCPVPPRCGHPRTVKKLVKKEYEVEKPVYKCVTKYLCDGCCEAQPAGAKKAAPASAAAPPGAPAPPIPSEPAPKPNQNAGA